MAVLVQHVDIWLSRCQENITDMIDNGINPDEFRRQYEILANIRKVVSGTSYFSGTNLKVTKVAKTTQ